MRLVGGGIRNRLRGQPSSRPRIIVFALVGSTCLFISGYFLARLTNQPIPTVFRANLRTRSLVFVAGTNPDSEGIFNSDFSRVTLTLTTPAHLEPAGPSYSGEHLAPPILCVANTVFDRVRLVNMTVPENLRVALDAESDGLLRYTLIPQFHPPHLR